MQLLVGRIGRDGCVKVWHRLRIGARAVVTHTEKDPGAGVFRALQVNCEQGIDGCGELALLELGQPEIERDIQLARIDPE